MKNNILGTKKLTDIAVENGAERFVFISTDKSVNPISMMGARKRLGKFYISDMDKIADGCIKFTITRFGDVFHFIGSVVDIFLYQLRNGENITLTNPQAEKYFMTINDANGLILKSLFDLNHKKAWLYILKVGDPIKIKDLSKRLIHEFFQKKNNNRSVDIIYSGLGREEKIKE